LKEENEPFRLEKDWPKRGKKRKADANQEEFP